MEINLLKQSYKNQLVRAGVDHHKAEQAVEDMTSEDLQLIQEIWSDWVLSPQTEDDTKFPQSVHYQVARENL